MTTNREKRLWSFPKTFGEVCLGLASRLAFVLLGLASVYNVWLYQQIFARLLELPWAWLQKAFGFVGWAVIQIAELMPFLIHAEIAFMALLAIAIQHHPKVSVASESPIIKRITDRVNHFPERWLFTAKVIASVVFVIDLGLVGWHFNVIETGILQQVNVPAAFQTVLSVFIFQFTFMFALFSMNGGWLVRTAKRRMEGEKHNAG